MRPSDWILALLAGAPLTSVGGVWLLGLVYSYVSEKLTVGRALGALGLLVFDGALVASGAVAVMRAYTTYHWLHPYGWVIAYGIVWFILLIVFFLAGGDRKNVAEFIASA